MLEGENLLKGLFLVHLYFFNAFNNTTTLGNKLTVLLCRLEANAQRPRTHDYSRTAAKQGK